MIGVLMMQAVKALSILCFGLVALMLVATKEELISISLLVLRPLIE